MKKKVKILVESIAGLGDAQPDAVARKYAKIEREMRSKARLNNGIKVSIYTEDQIRSAVDAERRKDDAEPRRGFTQDFSFKRGDEPLIDSELAEKWEAAGICAILDSGKKAAA